MENRIIYGKLTDWDNSSIDLDDLERLTEILAEKIENNLSVRSNIQVKLDKTQISDLDQTISIDWINTEKSKLLLELKPSGISYGFEINLNSRRFNHDFEGKYSSLAKRYFSNFQISKITNENMVVKSTFSVGSRQLNSRDFMDYTCFIFQQTVSFLEEIESINSIESFKIAV